MFRTGFPMGSFHIYNCPRVTTWICLRKYPLPQKKYVVKTIVDHPQYHHIMGVSIKKMVVYYCFNHIRLFFDALSIIVSHNKKKHHHNSSSSSIIASQKPMERHGKNKKIRPPNFPPPPTPSVNDHLQRCGCGSRHQLELIGLRWNIA